MTEESTQKCRVYVVDDERVIATTIAVILKQHGYEACDYSSGETALEAIRNQPPDVLIADLVMPGMSGVELAVEVRKHYPACRIMLFSGYINASVMLEDAYRQGFIFPVHTKPIYPDRLLEMLSHWRDPAQADGAIG